MKRHYYVNNINCIATLCATTLHWEGYLFESRLNCSITTDVKHFTYCCYVRFATLTGRVGKSLGLKHEQLITVQRKDMK